MDNEALQNLLPGVTRAVVRAGKAIMAIYEQEYQVEYKDNKSPVTEADTRAHEIIADKLRGYGYPVVSEESVPAPAPEEAQQALYWLVDPLDGTKEFIRKNGEFTINVALIAHGRPVLGVVAVPAHQVLFYACQGQGAWKAEQNSVTRLSSSDQDDPAAAVLAVSRSHLQREDQAFIDRHGIQHTRALGSALKYCEIAEGKADLSVRYTPLMQWDLAASDLIVAEAGGCITNFRRKPYYYYLEQASEALTAGVLACNRGLAAYPFSV